MNEKNKKDFEKGYRRMGNDVRGGKHKMTIYQDQSNLDDVLEVIYGRNVALKGIRAVFVVGNHFLDIVGELRKESPSSITCN